MEASEYSRCAWQSAVVAMCATLMLSGCFFDQLERSEEQDVQRVEQKQALVQAEQNKSVALKQQEDELAAELAVHQFSLSQLNDRVAVINANNGHSIADNSASRARYDNLLAQLQSTNEQLALAGQQSMAESTDERRQRVAYLRDRLRVQLDLLLR